MNDRATETVPEVDLTASTASELIKPKFLMDSFHCGHVINVILYHHKLIIREIVSVFLEYAYAYSLLLKLNADFKACNI